MNNLDLARVSITPNPEDTEDAMLMFARNSESDYCQKIKHPESSRHAETSTNSITITSMFLLAFMNPPDLNLVGLCSTLQFGI